MVCAVIPCLNNALTLSETIDSLITVDALVNLDIIVLDGGSTDYTADIVAGLQKLYHQRNISFVEFRPETHPARRVSEFIHSSKYDAVFICHSDDIYIPRAMQKQLSYFFLSGYPIVGAQNLFFSNPLDLAKGQIPNLYTGAHLTHPLSPLDIAVETNFWWAVSSNTLLIRPQYFKDGTLLDFEKYKYANDYDLVSRISRLHNVANVDFPTVVTRQRRSADGPTNLHQLEDEVKSIRTSNLQLSGLKDFLGEHLTKVLLSVEYAYGSWDLRKAIYPHSHYWILADRLNSLATHSTSLNRYQYIGKRLHQALSSQ